MCTLRKHLLIALILVSTTAPAIVNGQISRPALKGATRPSLLVIPPTPPTPVRMPARPSGASAARLTPTQIAELLLGAGVTPPASGLSGTFTLTASVPVAPGGNLDLQNSSTFTNPGLDAAVIQPGGVAYVFVKGDGTHTTYFVDCRVHEFGTAPIDVSINYSPYGILSLTNNHVSVVLTLVDAGSSSHVDLSGSLRLFLYGCDITPIR